MGVPFLSLAPVRITRCSSISLITSRHLRPPTSLGNIMLTEAPWWWCWWWPWCLAPAPLWAPWGGLSPCPRSLGSAGFILLDHYVMLSRTTGCSVFTLVLVSHFYKLWLIIVGNFNKQNRNEWMTVTTLPLQSLLINSKEKWLIDVNSPCKYLIRFSTESIRVELSCFEIFTKFEGRQV